MLHFHRQVAAMQQNQRSGKWQWLPPVDPGQRIIGIMGMGTLGSAAAQKLLGLGFQVESWSRGLEAIDGVTRLRGDEHIDGLLRLRSAGIREGKGRVSKLK